MRVNYVLQLAKVYTSIQKNYMHDIHMHTLTTLSNIFEYVSSGRYFYALLNLPRDVVTFKLQQHFSTCLPYACRYTDFMHGISIMHHIHTELLHESSSAWGQGGSFSPKHFSSRSHQTV